MAMHQAIIAKVDKVSPIPGADRIHVATVLGESVVVSKDVDVGYIGVLFPSDLQLSEQYCSENNLHRDSEKNKDNTKAGFFENTRRVRCQPFLKVRSEAYFASLESLHYTGKTEFSLGEQFDEINGFKICQKYISEKARKMMNASSGQKRVSKGVLYPSFEKHVSTEQFLHSLHKIEKGSLIYITAKAHGSSFRTSLKRESIQLPKWKELVNKIVPIFSSQTDYKLVTGSRNVVITEDHEGFHGSDKWRIDISKEIEPYLEPGLTIFGEVVGNVNQKPLMPPHDVIAMKDKRYTDKYGNTVSFDYGCKEHEYKWFVYRITREDVNGNNIDMTQSEMEKWCQARNIEHSFQVCEPFIYDGNEEAFKEKVVSLSERGDLLAECYLNPKAYGEGVVIRVENGKITPDFYKYKNYCFKVGEGLLDVDDVETLS